MRRKRGFTKRLAAIIVLVGGLCLVTGCSSGSEAQPPAKNQLHGLLVEGTMADKATVFFGVQDDLVAELASVRAGAELEQPWYLVEFPTAMLPGADDVKEFDLAKEQGITLRVRLQLPDQDPTGRWFWVTVDVASGSGGSLTGRLELSGTQVVNSSKGVSSDGTQRGFALDARHTGDVTVNGLTYHVQKGHIILGSLFGAVVDEQEAAE